MKDVMGNTTGYTWSHSNLRTVVDHTLAIKMKRIRTMAVKRHGKSEMQCVQTSRHAVRKHLTSLKKVSPEFGVENLGKNVKLLARVEGICKSQI